MTTQTNEPKRKSLDEIIRRLQVGEIKMSDLSDETVEALAGNGLSQYSDEQLREMARTGKLPD